MSGSFVSLRGDLRPSVTSVLVAVTSERYGTCSRGADSGGPGSLVPEGVLGSQSGPSSPLLPRGLGWNVFGCPFPRPRDSAGPPECSLLLLTQNVSSGGGVGYQGHRVIGS